MSDLSLIAEVRQLTGKKIKDLRRQGQIPAVLYGHKIKPQNLMVDANKFEEIYKAAGESTLIDLNIDKQKPIKVLIQEVQLDPITDKFLHIDFHQVRMDERLRTEVELKFINEPSAVKELSGILVTNIDTVEIECLPKDLVHEIEVDLSQLKTFADFIRVSDIKVPEGISILNSADEVIALVQPPRREEELEALEEKPKEVMPEEVEEVAQEKPEAAEKAKETTSESKAKEKELEK